MTTRGFFGRPPSKEVAERLPPGQYKTEDFPVLAMGPTPHVGLGRTSALQAHFQLLLVQLTRYRPVKRPVCGLTQAEVLVRDFRSLVERHFRERLPVQHYAARLRVSEDHLCRIVRKQTGMTASDLMQERVVVEANRLLVHLEANISDIAASLGYDDPAYFARLFKKCTGQTPSEFRSMFDGELTAQLAGSARQARATVPRS